MASFTLKSIPAGLHKEFSDQAKRHNRSVSKELLAAIEESVERHRPVDRKKLHKRIEQFRSSLKFTVTDEDINRFKREGRP